MACSRERDEQVIARDSNLSHTLFDVSARLQVLEEDFVGAPPDADKLEASLSESDILTRPPRHLSQEQLAGRYRAAEDQFRSYHGRVDASTYEQMLDNLIVK